MNIVNKINELYKMVHKIAHLSVDKYIVGNIRLNLFSDDVQLYTVFKTNFQSLIMSRTLKLLVMW